MNELSVIFLFVTMAEECLYKDCDSVAVAYSAAQHATLKRKHECHASSSSAKSLKEPSQDENPKLPVPFNILSMFGDQDKSCVQDDPAVHEGRIRSFAHERGNWASLIYIPLTSNGDLGSELSELLCEQLHMVANFHVVPDIHISLSKTFVMRHHWIEPMVADLRRKVALCCSGKVRLEKLEPYCNEEGSRTFIGLTAESTGGLLETLVKAIDSCLAEYNLPVYYKNPSFHVSLVWCLGDVRHLLDERLLSELQEIVERYFDENLEASFISVNELKFKTGNKIFVLPVDK